MKISTRGRYATMALVDIAQQIEQGHNRPIRLSEIAARQDIPLSYLEQIFVRLRRAGLVQSQRGPHGGYRLKALPQHINIADVIMASDEGVMMTRCRQDGIGCLKHAGAYGPSGRCLTHHLWVKLGQHIYEFFRNVSLADVIAHNVAAASLRPSSFMPWERP